MPREETENAIAVVTAALEQAREGKGADVLRSKGGRDVVTQTDIAVEDAMRTSLRGRSSLPVLGEERGGGAEVAATWVIDPICGTRNFASGVPLWCVNLALVEHDIVTAAVVGDASTGEILAAERGLGAWQVGTGPIVTSPASRTLIIEDGKSRGLRRQHAARFLAASVLADRFDLRTLSTTLSSAYVATGRMAGYVLFQGSIVHCAAGALLAAEAGAMVTDLAGDPWTIHADSLMVSADAHVHHELLALVRATREA